MDRWVPKLSVWLLVVRRSLSGNQRVLHFGPMAQRDPYFYYYPKGWDVLYPAHFGFFPYRTTWVTKPPPFRLITSFCSILFRKFRGSSSVVCICAFGVFMVLGGALMVGALNIASSFRTLIGWAFFRFSWDFSLCMTRRFGHGLRTDASDRRQFRWLVR